MAVISLTQFFISAPKILKGCPVFMGNILNHIAFTAAIKNYLMKSIISIVVAILLSMPAFSQDVPNGDMELWDTTFTPFPAGWLINAHYPSLPCSPAVLSATKTTDAYSGNVAAKLEAKECLDDLTIPNVYMGFMACGDTYSYPYLPYGVAYHSRPAQLEFYYKFLPVGGDTGLASVALLKLDSSGRHTTVVGSGTFAFTDTVKTYTQGSIAIHYYNAATPDVLQVVFATSKRLAEANQLSNKPGNGANTGTTLWIDHIGLSGGTTGIKEITPGQQYRVSPNPFNRQSVITFHNPAKEPYAFVLYDSRGNVVRTITHLQDDHLVIEKGSLSPGIYFFQLAGRETINGKVSVY